jgi:hypothetical protein
MVSDEDAQAACKRKLDNDLRRLRSDQELPAFVDAKLIL